MATYGLPPLPPFLETPGDATIPWEQWRDDFTNFLEATGMDAQPPLRKKAILLKCLGVEGRRVFRTLGPEPARMPDTTKAGPGGKQASRRRQDGGKWKG
ncbi:hypothetical protein MTO96_016292 [Rhipicephalus appendiculatus]